MAWLGKYWIFQYMLFRCLTFFQNSFNFFWGLCTKWLKQNTATCFLYGLSCIKMRSLRLAMLIKEIFPFSDQKILEIIQEIFGLSKIYLEIWRHYVLRLNIYNLYYISSYVLSYIINNNQNSNIAFKILTAQSLQLLHALIAKHFGLAVLCHNTKKKKT